MINILHTYTEFIGSKNPIRFIGNNFKRAVSMSSLFIAITPVIWAQDPVINEIVVSTASIDQEFLELLGTPGDSLTGLFILEVESGGEIDSVIPLIGNLGINGYYLLASPEAEVDLSVTGDQGIANNTFTNAPQTYLLVDGFSGSSGDDIDANDDGTIDNPLWSALLDSIAIIDNSSPVTYGSNIVGPDGTFLAAGGYRDPEGTGPFQLHGFSDPSGYTPTAAGSIATATAPVINEMVVNTTGTDQEFLELAGPPSSLLSGVSVLEILSGGEVDNVTNLVGSFGENGYFLLTSPQAEAILGVIGNQSIVNNTFTNGSRTYLLVGGFSGSIGNDIDANDDGTIDNPLWTDLFDSLALIDDDSPITYGPNVIGPDGSFLAPGAYRSPEVTGSFVIHDFSGGYTPTAGVGAPTDRFIHEIQGVTDLPDMTLVGGPGDADQSPLLGEPVRIQGIVTMVFQGGASLGGFYVQEEDSDADASPFSSEGIFVFSPQPVLSGDQVTVVGIVAEAEGETRINASSVVIESNGNPIPTQTPISFPTATALVDTDGDFVANLEQFEGMLVSIAQPMSVTELFQLDRFGTIRLSSDGRLEQFTQSNLPDSVGYAQHLKDIARRSLVFDDGLEQQNPSPIFVPGLSPDETLDGGDVLRMGDAFSNIFGVLSYSEDNTGSEEPEYRIHLPMATLTALNPSPINPKDVGGEFKVASFNVLNFFTTLDTFPDNELVGPNMLAPRGADTNPQGARPGAGPTDEYERQLHKLLEALVAMDADVVGLIEIENDFLKSGGISPDPVSAQDPRDIAIVALVDAINGVSTRRYDWIRPEGGVEFIGGDAIAVGIIYDTKTLKTKKKAKILETFNGMDFLDPNLTGQGRNRAALAQTFQERRGNEEFTVVVNHFKSKGASGLASNSSLSPDDVDLLDGQGYWNDTRTDAARILLDWLASDPTGAKDSDFLILGDLNAYRMEDPIQAILDGPDDIRGTDDDFVDVTNILVDPYSYVFDGQTGTLDYAMASLSMSEQVTGVTIWQINADEPDVFDYNLEFGRDSSLYTLDPFRSSDHDPVIVGLNLNKKLKNKKK